MRRLFRIIIRSLTVLSLLLCVATCMLWVRSYSFQDFIGYDFRPNASTLMSSLGSMWIGQSDYVPYHDGEGGLYWEENPITIQEGNNWLLFGVDWEKNGSHGAAFPHWFMALLFFLLPSLRLTRFIRNRRRQRAGHCPACGYDLRATPDRCPECGAVPAFTSIKGKQAEKPAPQ